MEICYAGCYTRAEKLTQYLKDYMLCLIAGGFDYMHFYSRDQKRLRPPVEIRPDRSYLLLVPPEITLKFSAGNHRENWVAMLELPEFEHQKDSLQCSVNMVQLDTAVEVTTLQLSRMRETFAAAVENISSGHPALREKAKMQINSLLAELISDPDINQHHHPIAEKMKQAIDEDLHFRYSLKDLNDRLGCCSLPYMRKLFFSEYGVMPGKYRNTLRMNRILELFAQSDFSLKMIADEVGMKHLPHLYAFLHRQQRLSPKELLAQIRGDRRF